MTLSIQVEMLIFLKSSSGRIPAGAALIDLNSLSNESAKLTLPIEKCPDKNASIEATLHYEVLNEVEVSESEVHSKRLRPHGSGGKRERREKSSRAEKVAIQMSQYQPRAHKHELKVPDPDFKMKMYQSRGSDREAVVSPKSQYVAMEASHEPPLESRHASNQRSYIDL